MVVVRSNGFREPGKGVAFLAATRLDDRQQALDETAARSRLRAERQLPPTDGVPQRLLGRVVGRLDPCDLHEGPQPVAVFPQLLAEAGDARVEVAAQQVSFYLRAGAVASVSEKRSWDNVPSRTFCHRANNWLVGRKRSWPRRLPTRHGPSHRAWKSRFQVFQHHCKRPPRSPIHPCPVAMDHAVERGAQHLLRHFGTPTGAAGEVGEGGSDEDPNPGLGLALLGR